jgi:hypothetical protein
MPRAILDLDPDVAVKLTQRQLSRGTTLGDEVNELLRAGLKLTSKTTRSAGRFETKTLPLGKPQIDSFDDVAKVLACVEGEAWLAT